MKMKGFFTLLISPELNPHHLMRFSVPSKTHLFFGRYLNTLQGIQSACSKPHTPGSRLLCVFHKMSGVYQEKKKKKNNPKKQNNKQTRPHRNPQKKETNKKKRTKKQNKTTNRQDPTETLKRKKDPPQKKPTKNKKTAAVKGNPKSFLHHLNVMRWYNLHRKSKDKDLVIKIVNPVYFS